MTLTVLPGFRDAHVHLALIDPPPLRATGIARVLDLGGWLPPHADSADGTGLEVAFAGQFLTAPGGYPSAQSWTPPGSVREVVSATDAAAAVDEQVVAGASLIKVTLNSAVGPVLSGALLTALVAQAHARGLPVVAHAEGAGQAAFAHRSGVDALAHTPFTERLSDAELVSMAGTMTWISTLDIHGWGNYGPDYERALDNLRRFHAVGGTVRYGTDLGNGPLPLGLNRRELAALLSAGLTPEDVLGTLTGAGVSRGRRVPQLPSSLHRGERDATAKTAETEETVAASEASSSEALVTILPGLRPEDPAEFLDWLDQARAVTRTELKELR